MFLPPLLAAAELFVFELELLLQAASNEPVIARIVSAIVTLFLFLIFTHPHLIVLIMLTYFTLLSHIGL